MRTIQALYEMCPRIEENYSEEEWILDLEKKIQIYTKDLSMYETEMVSLGLFKDAPREGG